MLINFHFKNFYGRGRLVSVSNHPLRAFNVSLTILDSHGAALVAGSVSFPCQQHCCHLVQITKDKFEWNVIVIYKWPIMTMIQDLWFIDIYRCL